MVATPISTTDRFVAPETTKTYWLDAAVDYTALTRLELDAGIDLTSEISDAAGWEIAADNVSTPDGGTLFTGQIRGRTNPGDASITFYADRTTADVRDVLADGDAGYVVHLHGGDVATQKMDVWPVEIRSMSAPIDYPASGAAMIVAQFSVKRPPSMNQAIPA